MTEEKNEENKNVSKAVIKHICGVCARPSETVICHRCEDKLRAEALEKKREDEHGY